MGTVYTKARIRDVDAIVKMAVKFESDHRAIVTRENPKIRPVLMRKKNWAGIFRKYVVKCIRSRNSDLFIAWDGKMPVGYSLLQIKKNIPVFEIEKLGHFGDLYVKKEYRGMGIGSKLKEIGMKWFRQKGMKHVSIGVRWGNKRARAIYEGWGFLPSHLEMVKKIEKSD